MMDTPFTLQPNMARCWALFLYSLILYKEPPNSEIAKRDLLK